MKKSLSLVLNLISLILVMVIIILVVVIRYKINHGPESPTTVEWGIELWGYDRMKRNNVYFSIKSDNMTFDINDVTFNLYIGHRNNYTTQEDLSTENYEFVCFGLYFFVDGEIINNKNYVKLKNIEDYKNIKDFHLIKEYTVEEFSKEDKRVEFKRKFTCQCFYSSEIIYNYYETVTVPKELFESSLKINGSEKVYIGIFEVVKNRTTGLYEFPVYDVIYSNAFFLISRIDDNTVKI